jgi:hypothetical protein
MSAWCFDRKWWLHAYIGMTTFGLYRNSYMYLKEFSFQVCSREICFPYLSHMMPWIDFPTGTPFRDRSLTFQSRGKFLERTTILVNL